MKKKLIALVVGAAAVAPAMAMAADVTVYGRAHVSVDYLDDGADYSETNLSATLRVWVSRVRIKSTRI